MLAQHADDVSAQRMASEDTAQQVEPQEIEGGIWSQLSTASTASVMFFNSRPLVGKHNILRKRLPTQENKFLESAGDAVMALVCSLGTLTFGAYEEPDIEGVDEFTTSGTRLKHLSHQILNDGIEGVLKIHLENAKNVPNYDFFGGKSDPYILFSTGWSQTASEEKTDDKNPVWDSHHYLLLRKPGVVKRNTEDLEIRLYNSNTLRGRTGERAFRHQFRKDDLLGSATLKIADLKEPGIHRKELALDRNRHQFKVKPTVSFTVEFLTFQEACSEWKKEKTSEAWLHKNKSVECNDSGNSDKHSPDASAAKNRWLELCKTCSAEYLDLKPVAYINGVKTGTQAWIHINRSEKVVAVAFRGTESKRPKDVLTDVNIVPSRFVWHKLPESDLKLSSALQKKRVRVHSGFLRAYHSVWEPIITIVHQITQWSKQWTICITGHSLGGALATLCAFEFANRLDENGLAPHIIMTNFGAPRVGNRDFVKVYEASVPESYRVVNMLDPIHRVPRTFKHVHHEVLFRENGEIVCDKRSSIKGDLGVNTVDEKVGEDSVFQAERRANKRSLLKTLGFQGHFETYYYDIVSYAARSWRGSPHEEAECSFEWTASIDIPDCSIDLNDWDIPEAFPRHNSNENE